MGTTLAVPLLREVYRETIRAGAFPFLYIRLPDEDDIMLTLADDSLLTTVSPINRLVVEEFDHVLHVMRQWTTGALLEATMLRMTEGALT